MAVLMWMSLYSLSSHLSHQKVRCLGLVVMGHLAGLHAPPRPNEEILHEILDGLSASYQSDMSELNQAYLAAIVSDGPSEEIKQVAVRSAIAERKATYVAEKNAAREMYPV